MLIFPLSSCNLLRVEKTHWSEVRRARGGLEPGQQRTSLSHTGRQADHIVVAALRLLLCLPMILHVILGTWISLGVGFFLRLAFMATVLAMNVFGRWIGQVLAPHFRTRLSRREDKL